MPFALAGCNVPVHGAIDEPVCVIDAAAPETGEVGLFGLAFSHAGVWVAADVFQGGVGGVFLCCLIALGQG